MQNISIDKNSDKRTANSQGPVDKDDVNRVKVMAKEALNSNSVNRNFMEPKSNAEKKRGRPFKNKPPDDIPLNQNTPQQPLPGPELPLGIPGAQAVKPLFELLSATMVRTTGTDKAKLFPEEIDSLANTWGMVLDRRSGQFIKENGDIIAASAVTLTVGFRLNKSLDEAIKIKKAEHKARNPKPDLNNVTQIKPDSPVQP